MHSPGAGKHGKHAKDISVSSNLRIVLSSFIASFSVLASSLLIQWFVYYDWLHQSGPVRIIGTSLATVLTFTFVFRWQIAVRERRLRILNRFATIARMNDVVRNALQTIECVTYLSRPESTEPVREAIDVIDGVLREVLIDVAWFEESRSMHINPYGREKVKKRPHSCRPSLPT